MWQFRSHNVSLFILDVEFFFFLHADEHCFILLCAYMCVGKCVFVFGRGVCGGLINAGPRSSALCYQSPLPALSGSQGQGELFLTHAHKHTLCSTVNVLYSSGSQPADRRIVKINKIN